MSSVLGSLNISAYTESFHLYHKTWGYNFLRNQYFQGSKTFVMVWYLLVESQR